MPAEVLDSLAVRRGQCVVDATIGLGGHAALILERIGPDGRLIGIDVDEENLRLARKRLLGWKNVRFFRANFADIGEVLRQAQLRTTDALVADLGLSSNQLYDPGRGFSFERDGPLDMRLDRHAKLTARDLVNGLAESALAELIYTKGGEHRSRRIARAIHQSRRNHRIQTTKELADTICAALREHPKHHRSKIHPATKTFMALRIEVNRELESLEKFLEAIPAILNPGGRAAVISFHSLEDGRAKAAFRRMREQGTVKLLNKRPLTPTDIERKSNPRSRSAKLRAVERTDLILNSGAAA